MGTKNWYVSLPKNFGCHLASLRAFVETFLTQTLEIRLDMTCHYLILLYLSYLSI